MRSVCVGVWGVKKVVFCVWHVCGVVSGSCGDDGSVCGVTVWYVCGAGVVWWW